MPLPWHKTSVTTQQLPLYPPLHHLFTQCGTPIPPSVDLMLSSILPAQASAFYVLCPILRALVVPLLGGVLHTGAHSSVSIFHSSVSSGVHPPPCLVWSLAQSISSKDICLVNQQTHTRGFIVKGRSFHNCFKILFPAASMTPAEWEGSRHKCHPE